MPEDLRHRVRRDRLVGAAAHPGVGLLAEAGPLQLLEEATEPARRASTAPPEHLPEHVGDAAAGPRTAASPSVRQQLEHDGHQRRQHLAHAGSAARRPSLLLLGTIAHRLSGQSTEKIVEDTHGNLPVARMRRRAMGDER